MKIREIFSKSFVNYNFTRKSERFFPEACNKLLQNVHVYTQKIFKQFKEKKSSNFLYNLFEQHFQQ